MNQVVEHMSVATDAKNTVEIVVHVSEYLEDQKRKSLVVDLENVDGIVSAEFCPLRYHLMLVRYDRENHSSQDILSAFDARKLKAKLIGPI